MLNSAYPFYQHTVYTGDTTLCATRRSKQVRATFVTVVLACHTKKRPNVSDPAHLFSFLTDNHVRRAFPSRCSRDSTDNHRYDARVAMSWKELISLVNIEARWIVISSQNLFCSWTRGPEKEDKESIRKIGVGVLSFAFQELMIHTTLILPSPQIGSSNPALDIVLIPS